jgi:hypothetical protein
LANEFNTDASARISNGQGYQGFLRKRAGSVLAKKGQFASYKEKLEKWTEFHSSRVNTMFSLIAQRHPLVAEGHGALQKMPSRSTNY